MSRNVSNVAPDVTIVGAGMAGMTAALRLLEAGFTVRVLEASDGVGGKFGAHRTQHGYHDFAWHVFAKWCLNFWDIANRIGLSEDRDFAARPKLTLLRPLGGHSNWPRVTSVSYVGSPEFFWQNVRSGVAHWSDLLLFTYSLYALLGDQDLDNEEFLNRVTVNGYMRSLPGMSDVAALLHNELLLRIWAIPSYLISARSYQTYLQLIAPYPYPASPVVVLKKDFESSFWRPFRETLGRVGPAFTLETGARLSGIRLAPDGRQVDSIVVQYQGESAARIEKVRQLIVAIPPGPLLSVLGNSDSRALRETNDGRRLLDLSKLQTQQTSTLSLYFNRRIEIPGNEPVALIDHFEEMYERDTLAQRNGLASAYGLSFLDVGGLWKADHPTVLSVLASDADSLRILDEDEACRRVLAELRRFIHFEDGDIDWSYSEFQAHRNEQLFVNTVGSWEYRPEVRLSNSAGRILGGQVWRNVGNLYLAGDYCRSQVDIVSLEGAAHTGIWAAHALSGREVANGRSGVRIVPPPRPPRDWDPRAVQEVLGQLDRWVRLGAGRSRVVAQEFKARAARGADRAVDPRGSTSVAAGPLKQTAMRGGETMGHALSTSPGLAIPIRSEQVEWLAKKYRQDTRRVTLSSGAIVSVPLLFWEARALMLEGTVDADTVDGVFGSQDLRAWRDPNTGKGVVSLWAPDYAGTSVGPIKSIFATIRVEPQSKCSRADRKLAHHWWWWYYGNSVVNHEFKEQVWGVRNQLGSLETSYESDAKAARLLENGRSALRLRLDLAKALKHPWSLVHGGSAPPQEEAKAQAKSEALAKAGVSHRLIELGKLDERLAELAKLSSSHAALWQQAEEEKEDRINIGSKAEAEDDDGEASKQYDEGTPPSRFVSVSHRPNAMDENEVDLFGVAKLGLPFDKANRNDECEWGKDTHVGKELERVDFEPTSWSYFASYSGVVKIFDGKGSNVRPEREDEQYARRIGEGLLRSIPELKKERQ